MKKALTYSFGAIALYLAVAYSTGFGQDITAGASGGSSLIKSFQGR